MDNVVFGVRTVNGTTAAGVLSSASISAKLEDLKKVGAAGKLTVVVGDKELTARL